MRRVFWLWLVAVVTWAGQSTLAQQALPKLKLEWKNNLLKISGPQVPGGFVPIWYMEAYCRPGSTERLWRHTTIGHTTRLVQADPQGHWLHLQCRLKDGVVVDHRIEAGVDEVTFRIRAHNPTNKISLAHWAQPCVRVDRFTGRTQKDYLPKCFIFVNGRLTRMPFEPWATRARYVPGQVWCAPGVPRSDVNPRPLSPIVPSNGLIGCFSADEKKILAIAFQPYQELFQGVIVCIHSDFRIGGLEPGQTKHIRGKLYIVDADVPALLKRYWRDFPEHRALHAQQNRSASSDSGSN